MHMVHMPVDDAPARARVNVQACAASAQTAGGYASQQDMLRLCAAPCLEHVAWVVILEGEGVLKLKVVVTVHCTLN